MIEELVAFHLAAALVTLYRFVRSRDRRLLPLVGLFLCLGAGFHFGPWHAVGRPLLYAAGLCGVALLLMLSPRTR